MTSRTAAAERWGWILLMLAIGLFFGPLGCASTRIGATLVLPPTTIVGDPTGRNRDIYDAYELFDRGDKAYVGAEWDKAALNYNKILKEYADSEVAPLARYNLGLVDEQTGQWDKALRVYREFPNPPGHGVLIEEVRMRAGVCLVKLERYAEAEKEFESILGQFGVSPLIFNEARARLGIAAYYAGDEVLAEHHLEMALPENDRNLQRGIVHARAAYAEGYFIMGEIYYRRFAAVALSGEEAALAQDLREKAEYLIAARDYYTQAVRTYEPLWITAALYKIGLGFEEFYRAVLAIPDPREMPESERAGYREKLEKKLYPVLDKALTAYRRNLQLAADLGQNNQWVQLTREHYEQLSRLTTKEEPKP